MKENEAAGQGSVSDTIIHRRGTEVMTVNARDEVIEIDIESIVTVTIATRASDQEREGLREIGSGNVIIDQTETRTPREAEGLKSLVATETETETMGIASVIAKVIKRESERALQAQPYSVHSSLKNPQFLTNKP